MGGALRVLRLALSVGLRGKEVEAGGLRLSS